MDTRHLGQAWGFSFGFHTFVACHVTRLPLTTYHLPPVTTCHLPLSSLRRTRTSTRPYPFPLPFRTRRHFFQFARSVRNVCHNGLSNDNVPRGGYYIQQAEWPKDAWLPGWLADWLPGSIQFQLEPVLNRFLLLFLFRFILVFLFFLFCSPCFFFCIRCWLCSFIRHYRRTMRAVCRLLLWLNVVQ